MPGIMTVVNDAGVDQPCVDLQRMIQRVVRQADLSIDTYQGDFAAVAGIHLDKSKTIATDPGVVLAVAGEVVEFEALRRRLSDCGQDVHSIHTQSELLLKLFQVYGLESICGLNGAYAIIVWEPDLRRLTLVRDRFGLIGLYYWQTNGLLMAATEYKAITWHPQFEKSIDDVALADLFLYRTWQGNRTLFKNIRMVPPASTLVYQDGQVKIQNYWKPSFFSAGQPMLRMRDYVDGLDQALREAVRRRVRPQSCLMLTGGLDSRVIAGLYHQVAPEQQLQTNSIGTPACHDVEIGREVAHTLGYLHDWIRVDDGYYQQIAPKGSWRSEGKLHSTATWIYLEEPYLREKELRYVLTGLYGNMISGRHFSPALVEADSIDQAVEVLRLEAWPRVSALKNLMRAPVARQAIQASLDWQEEIFRKSQASDLLNRFDELGLLTIVSHTSQNLDIFGDAAGSLDPFTDNDLMDFALQMPPRMRAGGLFYLKMIVEYLPKLAGIDYGRTGHPVKLEAILNQYPWFERIDHLQRQIWKRIRPDQHRRNSICIPQADAIRGSSRQFVFEVLSRADLLEDYFDMNAVRQMLEDHIAGRINAFKPIGSLVSFALWRQQFCESQIEVSFPVSRPLDRAATE